MYAYIYTYHTKSSRRMHPLPKAKSNQMSKEAITPTHNTTAL